MLGFPETERSRRCGGSAADLFVLRIRTSTLRILDPEAHPARHYASKSGLDPGFALIRQPGTNTFSRKQYDSLLEGEPLVRR